MLLLEVSKDGSSRCGWCSSLLTRYIAALHRHRSCALYAIVM
jgi:hypothetical protein